LRNGEGESLADDEGGHELARDCLWFPALGFCLSYFTDTMRKTRSVTPWMAARRKK